MYVNVVACGFYTIDQSFYMYIMECVSLGCQVKAISLITLEIPVSLITLEKKKTCLLQILAH